PQLLGSLFQQVQSLSCVNLDRLETGGLITRLTNDIVQLTDAVQMMLRILVRAPLLLVGSIVMAVLTAPQLSLLFVVLLPVLMVMIGIVMMKAFPRFRQVQKKLDHANGVIQESLAGMRVVKAFARHSFQTNRFEDSNSDLRDTTLNAVYVVIIVMPL